MARMMSGIQPTGSLHLGNYLGALRSWVRYQAEYEAFFAVVDLHALTIRPEPQALRRGVREIAIGILASGVDPKRATLFVQSQVPEHTRLAWVLNCFTPVGDLNRMTQWKDKAQQFADTENAGLFTYPILQTADVALYRAERVPVGEDQVQHLELARETIRRFNGIYGPTLVEPQPILSQAPRVLGIDGEMKMSKSKGNEIGMFEEPAEVWSKLKVAKTDPARLRRSDKGEPTRCNVFSWHLLFSDAATIRRVEGECRSAAIGCVDCKKLLAEGIERELGPIRERSKQLRAETGYVEDVLQSGARKAHEVAAATMAQVEERIGLRG
jgi:tryptophanyl-tRNA synthetase